MPKQDYNWLTPHLPLIKNRHVLELGCGAGRDSAVLCQHAKSLQAVDLKTPQNPITNPNYTFTQLDLHDEFNFKRTHFDLIIASLCLHYFDWQATLDIMAKIKAHLAPNGWLIGRVNSVDDVFYGASGHPKIEHGLFNVNGTPKRFFDEAMLKSLFADGWELTHFSAQQIDRYQQPKSIFEFIAKPKNNEN